MKAKYGYTKPHWEYPLSTVLFAVLWNAGIIWVAHDDLPAMFFFLAMTAWPTCEALGEVRPRISLARYNRKAYGAHAKAAK